MNEIYISSEKLIELRVLEFFINLKCTLIDSLRIEKHNYIEPIKEIWIKKDISIKKILDLALKL
jgi:hypothetical protein